MAPRCEPSRLVHVPSAATGAWTTRSLVNVTPPHRDDRSGVWHSQHGQDRVVSTLLASKHGGYFIDLAASEPLMHSNTRALERDFGWNGICIEANPRYWDRFASWRPCCSLVGAAVATRREELGFHAYGPFSGMGGLIVAGADNARRNATMRVQAVPIAEIISRFRVPPAIDYLSLDLEGAEGLAMATFPFATHRIAVLSVERPKLSLQAVLEANGYRYHCTSVGQTNLSLRANDQIWVGPVPSTARLAAEVEAAAASVATSGSTDAVHLRRRAGAKRRCDVLHARSPLALQEWKRPGGAQCEDYWCVRARRRRNKSG